VAEQRVEDACLLQIRRDFHARQGHETDPWIVDMAREQRRQLLADFLTDAVGTRTLAHLSKELHLMRGHEAWTSDVVRTIHGYDAAVIWKGARASS
jgi:hypothetical protein